MPWQVDFILQSISLIVSYILIPFLTFSTWCLVYNLGVIALKSLCKIRYEVFNEDLKYNRSECKNRIVVVTGATSGIGLAAANHFYTKGFVVIACYYSEEEPGYEELDLLTEAVAPDSRSMYLIKLDVKSMESIENCYKQVRVIMADRLELRLHALVNVAGVGYFHKFQWMTRDQIENLVKTNLLGPMLMTRQFLHLLVGNPGSRVVNVASFFAFLPMEFNCVYGATKAGLTMFTNALEADMSRYGIKTVTIQPGNLIKNTSIISSSVKTKLEKITPELNDDEKRIYRVELNEHERRLESYERALKRTGSIIESGEASLVPSTHLERVGQIVSGGFDGTKLHQNKDFIQSFDNSVRIKDPPREIFAGNIFHTLIWGSALEWTSRGLVRDIFLSAIRKRFDMSKFLS